MQEKTSSLSGFVSFVSFHFVCLMFRLTSDNLYNIILCEDGVQSGLICHVCILKCCGVGKGVFDHC